MSFDKAKAMRNAERFLAQGKIRAAINEYQRVVETDKADYSTLNILGDLFAKASEPDEAVACFTQVAEHYGKQGFAQKAIAIYNKISRLKPDLIEVSAKLAQLYQAKGSIAEARTHYATLAEQYSRNGKKAEALGVWKQIASLDSSNTDIYLKIADACWQDQQKEEAASAYIEAGKRLNIKKKYESAVTAFSRALEINPDDVPALKGFTESQIQLGYAEDAASSLESSLARQPHNRDLMYLLVDCYLETGNIFEAEKAVIKLVEQEPSNYPKLLDLVHAYLKNNDLESATRILTMASEHLLVGGQAPTLESLVDEILLRNPEQLDAVRLLVRLHTWQRDESAIKSSFEKLAEVAKIHNAIEDERYALEQLVMISPQNAYFAQRLQELNLANGYTQGFYEPSKDKVKSSGDVPTFESFNGLGQQDEAKSQTDAVVAEYGSALNYSNGKGNEHLKGFHFIDEVTPPQTIESDNTVETEELENSSFESDSETIESRELTEFELHNLQKEIEGIDFYVEQGFNDLAEKSLKDLEKRFGKHTEIDKIRESLNLTNTVPSNENTEPEAMVETEATDLQTQVSEPVETTETESVEAGEKEITIEPESLQTEVAFVQEELENDKPETEADEVETQEIENESVEIEPEANEIETAVETENEVDEIETQEIETDYEETAPEVDEIKTQAVENEQVEIESEVTQTETQAIENETVETPQVSLETDLPSVNSFDAFKSAIVSDESLASDDGDFETKYQMGMAYKEMGLTEDAIREFQDAIKIVAPEDGTRRFYWCCNLLGHCFIEKGMANLALMWFKRALETKNLSDEESQGIRYELANAYELGGDKQKAIQYFEEIYGVNVDFRDVGARLQNLMSN